MLSVRSDVETAGMLLEHPFKSGEKRMHKANTPSSEETVDQPVASNSTDLLNLDQLRHLIHLLDRSDVSEIELTRASEGLRLVLRKPTFSEEIETFVVEEVGEDISTGSTDNKQTIIAPLVGIYRPWSKPRGKSLISVGDRVTVGQVVASIESLGVFNDVESQLAGVVGEILAKDGDPIEYGQPLIIIERIEEA